MNTKIQLVQLREPETYGNTELGITVYREWGKTPNGNDFNGNWVVRQYGVYVDHDRYRIDLSQRRGLQFPSAYL